MKAILIGVFFVCLAPIGLADELPDIPKPKPEAFSYVEKKPVFLKRIIRERTADKKFFAVYGALGVSAAFDWKSTSDFLARCPHCKETNPIVLHEEPLLRHH
jgi:hypothetical protein